MSDFVSPGASKKQNPRSLGLLRGFLADGSALKRPAGDAWFLTQLLADGAKPNCDALEYNPVSQ